jgi:hypothetical protein
MPSPQAAVTQGFRTGLSWGANRAMFRIANNHPLCYHPHLGPSLHTEELAKMNTAVPVGNGFSANKPLLWLRGLARGGFFDRLGILADH